MQANITLTTVLIIIIQLATAFLLHARMTLATSSHHLGLLSFL